MMLWLASWVLAGLLGFAAHRTSVCTVRAVAEVLSTARFSYFASFAKSALWTLVVVMPFLWVVPEQAGSIEGYAPTWLSVVGGFVFGVGAAINRGCAFSTLARLVDGDLRMLITFVGFALGALLSIVAMNASYLSRPVPATPLIHHLLPYAGALSLVLLGWGAKEFHRIWSSRPLRSSALRLMLLPQYRLSTSAMLMGLANGALYFSHGSWAYTGILHQGIEGLVTSVIASPIVRAALFLAVLSGMAVSTWQRGGLKLRWRPQAAWSLNAIGGLGMGAGAALIPGGNDSLVLFSIPMLATHAVPAYAAMLIGIGAMVQGMAWITGSQMRVECKNDICTTISP